MYALQKFNKHFICLVWFGFIRFGHGPLKPDTIIDCLYQLVVKPTQDKLMAGNQVASGTNPACQIFI